MLVSPYSSWDQGADLAGKQLSKSKNWPDLCDEDGQGGAERVVATTADCWQVMNHTTPLSHASEQCKAFCGKILVVFIKLFILVTRYRMSKLNALNLCFTSFLLHRLLVLLHSAPVMFECSRNYAIEKEDNLWAWSPFKHELNHKWSEPNLWNQRILHEKRKSWTSHYNETWTHLCIKPIIKSTFCLAHFSVLHKLQSSVAFSSVQFPQLMAMESFNYLEEYTQSKNNPS